MKFQVNKEQTEGEKQVQTEALKPVTDEVTAPEVSEEIPNEDGAIEDPANPDFSDENQEDDSSDELEPEAWTPKLYALRQGSHLTTAVKVGGKNVVIKFEHGSFTPDTEELEQAIDLALTEHSALRRTMFVPDVRAAERIVAAHKREQASKNRSLKGAMAHDAVREKTTAELEARDLALLKSGADPAAINNQLAAQGTDLTLTTAAHAPSN